VSILDVPGPASYTAVVTGSPPTGGQLITAADCGLQSLDWVQSQGSDDGQYDIMVVPAPFSLGNPMPAVRLMWVVAATGAQVTAAVNLSARTVRLYVTGR
jgi:hypothetical protein